MVSGFLTSPNDHWRMSSAEARPIRSSSKKLTSSTSVLLSFLERQTLGLRSGTSGERDGSRPRQPSAASVRPNATTPKIRGGGQSVHDVVDGRGLVPGQVDAQVG